MLSYRKIIPTNKIVDNVYDHHIKHKSDGLLTNKLPQGTRFNSKEVADLICLHIMGVQPMLLKEIHGFNVTGVVNRSCYRNLDIPYQESRRKKLGKMVFTYNKELVIDYFNNLPTHLQSLSNGKICKSRLVKVTKILEHELWI